MADLTPEELAYLDRVAGVVSGPTAPPPAPDLGDIVSGAFASHADPRQLAAIPELLASHITDQTAAPRPGFMSGPVGRLGVPMARTLEDMVSGISKLPAKLQAEAIGSLVPILGTVLGPGAKAVTDRVQNPEKPNREILSEFVGDVAGNATLAGIFGVGNKAIQGAVKGQTIKAARTAQPGWESLVKTLDASGKIPGKSLPAVQKNMDRMMNGYVRPQNIKLGDDLSTNTLMRSPDVMLAKSGLAAGNMSESSQAALTQMVEKLGPKSLAKNPKLKEVLNLISDAPDLNAARETVKGLGSKAMALRDKMFEGLDAAATQLKKTTNIDGTPVLEDIIDPSDISGVTTALKKKVKSLDKYPHEATISAIENQIADIEALVETTQTTIPPRNAYAARTWPEGVVVEKQNVPTTLTQLNEKMKKLNSLRQDLEEFDTSRSTAGAQGKNPSKGITFDPEITALREAQGELRGVLNKKIDDVRGLADAHGVPLTKEARETSLKDVNQTYSATKFWEKSLNAANSNLGVGQFPKTQGNLKGPPTPEMTSSINPLNPFTTRLYGAIDWLTQGRGGPSLQASANDNQAARTFTGTSRLNDMINLRDNPAFFQPPEFQPAASLGGSVMQAGGVTPPMQGLSMGAEQNLSQLPAGPPPPPPAPPPLISRTTQKGAQFDPESLVPALSKLPDEEANAVYGAVSQAARSGDPLELARAVGGFLTAFPEAATSFAPSQTGLVSEYNGIIADPIEKDKYKGRIERALWAGHINANQYGDIVSRLNVDSPLGELPESLRAVGPRPADPNQMLEALFMGQRTEGAQAPQASPVGWQPQTPIQDYSPISESAFSPLLKVP